MLPSVSRATGEADFTPPIPKQPYINAAAPLAANRRLKRIMSISPSRYRYG